MNRFISTSASLLASSVLSQATVIFTDDVEDTWTGNGSFTTTNFGGLLTPFPQAGTGAYVINGGNFRTFDTGVTIAAGTYIYTAMIGNWSNAGFHDQPVAFNLRHTLNFDLDGYETSASRVSPASGAWEQWTVTYEIPEGAPEIGQTITAVYWANGSTAGTNSAFDGPLTIDFTPVPEPSSSILLALAGMTLLRRRR